MISDILLALFLACIQGLTEFLPVSSSAHLLLPSMLFGVKDFGLMFDIAVHAGTLVAVVYYFSSDLRKLFLSWLPWRNDRNKEEILLNHSYNKSQIEWFKHGSALNVLRNKK